MKTAFITDSASGYSIDEFAKEGIFSLPLQVSIANRNYFDLENIMPKDAVLAMHKNERITTSQPNLGLIEDLFKKIKEEGFKQAVCCPICPGLSSTSDALKACGRRYDIPVYCVDTGTTAYFEADTIRFLKKVIDNGMEIEEAFKIVKESALKANTLLVFNDLKQVKAGGRLTPAAYHMANIMRIKPLLAVNLKTGGKIDTLQKILTFKRAIEKMYEYMKKEINPDIKGELYVTHVDNEITATNYAMQVIKEFPNLNVHIKPLVTPVAAHMGLGAIAIQYYPLYQNSF